MSRRIKSAIACAVALAVGACATDPRTNYEDPSRLISGDEVAFGGEALAQRKLELQRAVADLGDFLETLTSMKDREDEHGIALFRRFVDRYLLTHVGPLLAPEWQSHHPELIRHDANLRFIQSELLIELSYKKWARDEIKALRDRYKERGNMLVEYPIGQQTTLREALATLRSREAHS
ncbi:MAG: hypothetical protein GY944_03265 [bacterium]|nr:hypothetical protein [bacterium]